MICPLSLETSARTPAFEELELRTVSYRELRQHGMTRRRIEHAVASGTLVRLRRGTYASSSHPREVLEAARHGGRLDCVSYLAMLGVFVLRGEAMHVQMNYGSTRVPARTDRVIRHWRTTNATAHALTAPLIEALAQACRCQSPREAVATLDSAWHQGLIDEEGIAQVFRRLPERFGVLRAHLDQRAESGPETLMRLLLRSQGWRIDVQVDIDGVGRVDLVVDGWLIIECDSEAHHSGWPAQKRDRRRDLEAARRGYTTLRPVAEDIMFRPDVVLDAIRGAVAHRALMESVHNVATPRPRTARRGA